MRFELTAYALNPDIKIIAPWREWEFKSRTDLIDFAEKNQIQVAKDKRGEAPFSVDANLLHSSSEGKVLEDPWIEPPPYVYQRTIAPEEAPDKATVDRDRIQEGRSGCARRQGDVAGDAASPRSTISAATTASAASISSRTASSA